MKSFQKIAVGLILIAILFNCSSKKSTLQIPSTPTKSYPLTDKKLWPLFEKFEVEAKKRGRTINLANQQIRAKIEAIPPATGSVGLCNRASNNDRNIIIDQAFWQQHNSWNRELIVFHELGHCSLNLSHREGQTNGICNSIMRSGHGGCIDNYTASTSVNLLDELFGRLD
ncbi:MAG: hypothetical protein AAF960_11840 [Bacteroidota bacterium]